MWHATQALTGSKLAKRTIIAKGLNLSGPKLSFLYIGGQNRNFLKLKGRKVPLA